MNVVAYCCYIRPHRNGEEDAPGTGTGTGTEERLALLLKDEDELFIFVPLILGDCVEL
jgi:hypothetical protein